jgi:hypothetical protein
MKLQTLGSNQTQISKADGSVIFFSYNTPVAACVNGTFFRTGKKWSNTTSKHITRWLDGRKAETRDQSFFDSLV